MSSLSRSLEAKQMMPTIMENEHSQMKSKTSLKASAGEKQLNLIDQYNIWLKINNDKTINAGDKNESPSRKKP